MTWRRANENPNDSCRNFHFIHVRTKQCNLLLYSIQIEQNKCQNAYVLVFKVLSYSVMISASNVCVSVWILFFFVLLLCFSFVFPWMFRNSIGMSSSLIILSVQINLGNLFDLLQMLFKLFKQVQINGILFINRTILFECEWKKNCWSMALVCSLSKRQIKWMEVNAIFPI